MLDNLAINGRDLLVQMGGFLLLFWLLSRYLFSPLSQVISEREHRIKEKMDEAERNSLEMQAMRDEYQRRIAAIETESRDRIQSAMKEALAAKDRLLEEARVEAEKLLERGREELVREQQKAMVETRDQIVDLAIHCAEKLIERNIDEKAHRAMIDDIIEHGVRAS
ncbi:MAG: F0F1 ATP synthase subunit B [Candidatus Riflebacteria bacterium]|nr:F0F1 ATP synthase subunit B [Candidatus Riflebacteria bacterium]